VAGKELSGGGIEEEEEGKGVVSVVMRRQQGIESTGCVWSWRRREGLATLLRKD
jgi:hypothetical protein